MSNCYDYSGNETNCQDEFCIGSDCANAPNMEDPTFEDVGMGGTEGLWDMDGEGFQEWFEDLYDWGEPYAMFNEDGGDVPHWIDLEDAQKFTTIFQQYNNYNEILAQTQFFRDQNDADALYATWAENAHNALLDEEFWANEGVDIRNRHNLLMSDYENALASIENKNNRLMLNEDRKKRESVKSSKGLHDVETEEDKLYREEVLDTFEDYSNNQDRKKRDLFNRMNDLERAKDARIDLSRVKTERIAADKLLNKDLTVKSLWRSTKNKIIDMREEYEANLYNTMASLASAGAFMTMEPPSYSWTLDPVDDFQGCTAQCQDGCDTYVDCGSMSAGFYFVNYDCCDEEPGQETNACIVTGTGQCQWLDPDTNQPLGCCCPWEC